MASTIGDANRSIAQALDAFDQQARVLRSQWSGAASDAYDTAHREWTARLEEMNRILALADAAVASSADRYASGHQKIKERWS